MKKELCASAFIVNPVNKKLLLVHHSNFDAWVQPGGHVDENEAPEEAAVREIYEETGVRTKLLGDRFPRENDYIKPIGIMKNVKKDDRVLVDIIYVGIPLNMDEVEADEEIDKHRWFSREELEDVNIFPDIKITMDHVLREYFNER